MDSLEGRLHELDVANKELTDHKYRSEAAIRELKTKLKSSEEVSPVGVVSEKCMLALTLVPCM